MRFISSRCYHRHQQLPSSQKLTHHISRILLSHFISRRIAKIAADPSRFTAPTKHTFGLFLTHYRRLLLLRPRELGTRLLKTP